MNNMIFNNTVPFQPVNYNNYKSPSNRNLIQNINPNNGQVFNYMSPQPIYQNVNNSNNRYNYGSIYTASTCSSGREDNSNLTINRKSIRKNSFASSSKGLSNILSLDYTATARKSSCPLDNEDYLNKNPFKIIKAPNNLNNSEILNIQIRLENNSKKIHEIKLCMYDDLDKIARNFCENNNLSKEIAKSLALKISSSLKKIYYICNLQMEKSNYDNLKNINNIWNEKYVNKPKQEIKQTEEDENNIMSISSITLLNDSTDENSNNLKLNNSM